jgi:16S rRNA (adenine(1408)-N(1))-methyltransferase
VAAPSDNSNDKNLSGLLPRTGEGVVIDIGTGDGRFVSAAARQNPNKFFIGIDANTKPLEKISMKATRNPKTGGLPNAMFVQAAVEDLPEELNRVADEIHIHFPWGSLLRAVAVGDDAVLASLRRISAPDCLLEIVIGIDKQRDRTELERLSLPELSAEYLKNSLIPKYRNAGFKIIEEGFLDQAAWSQLETSWARKLSGARQRKVWFLVLTVS